MDRFDGGRNLRNIAPKNLFRDGVGGAMTESVGACEVVFDKRLGKWEVIGDEDEGAIAKCAGSESVDD
jgi:hypothetical protein